MRTRMPRERAAWRSVCGFEERKKVEERKKIEGRRKKKNFFHFLHPSSFLLSVKAMAMKRVESGTIISAIGAQMDLPAEQRATSNEPRATRNEKPWTISSL
jgi:hypothetical protein